MICSHQIDDYSHWEGCRKAVHDLEQEIGAFFQLHVVDDSGTCLTPANNRPLPLGENLDGLTPRIRLSQVSLALFPDWDPDLTETLMAELEPLLQEVVLSCNPQDYALMISIISAELDSGMAQSVLEMADGARLSAER